MSDTPTRGKFTWCVETNKLIPFEDKRSDRACTIFNDEIPGGIQSMADCKFYTSKSELRKSYKRLGKYEIGNDEMKPNTRERDEAYDRKVEEVIEKAYYKLRDGNADLSEETRERCKIINHNLEHYNYDRREFDEDGNPRR